MIRATSRTAGAYPSTGEAATRRPAASRRPVARASCNLPKVPLAGGGGPSPPRSRLERRDAQRARRARASGHGGCSRHDGDRSHAGPRLGRRTRRSEPLLRVEPERTRGDAAGAGAVTARCGIHDRLHRTRVRRVRDLGLAARARGDPLSDRAPRIPGRSRAGEVRGSLSPSSTTVRRPPLQLHARRSRASALRSGCLAGRGAIRDDHRRRRSGRGRRAGDALRRHQRPLRPGGGGGGCSFPAAPADVRPGGNLHTVPRPLHRGVRHRGRVGPGRPRGRVLHADGARPAGRPVSHPGRTARDVLPAPG